MIAKFEFAASIMDLVAFFLVTPQVLTGERFIAWFNKGGIMTKWLREVYMNRDDNMVAVGFQGLVTCIFIYGIFLLPYFNMTYSADLFILIWIGILVCPIVFVGTYLLLARMAGPLGIIRMLVICGAALFMIARIINIVGAWSRVS